MHEYKIFEKVMGEELAASVTNISLKPALANPSGVSYTAEAEVSIPVMVMDAEQRNKVLNQNLSFFDEVVTNLENQAVSLVKGVTLPTAMNSKIMAALLRLLTRIYRGDAPYSAYITRELPVPRNPTDPMRSIVARVIMGINNNGQTPPSVFWLVASEVVSTTQATPGVMKKERTVEMLIT
jgi:hypothetical protein